MGTSKSNDGSPSRVPMVPPWVPDIEVPNPVLQPVDLSSLVVDPSEIQQVSPQKLAPNARWRSARSAFQKFAQNGSITDRNLGLKHFVKKGFGGSRTATKRFAGTSNTASKLFDIISGGTPSGLSQAGTPNSDLSNNHNAEDIVNAIIETVKPVDGTQDAESSRAAINDAFSDLLTTYPDADLLNLDENQKQLVIERFISYDVYRRISLELGSAVRDKSPNAKTCLQRLKEIRDYVRETISNAFRKFRSSLQRLNVGHIKEIATMSIHEAFIVFEEYVK